MKKDDKVEHEKREQARTDTTNVQNQFDFCQTDSKSVIK